MGNKSHYLLMFIALCCCFYGCKFYNSCSSELTYTIHKHKAKNIYDINEDFFLCYMEEEPVVYTMDSSLESSLPWYFRGSKKYLEHPAYLEQVRQFGHSEKDGLIISYTFIKLKVKPVDEYFTKYSYDDFKNLNMDIREGRVPKKEPFLNFNTLYYITCSNLSEINWLTDLYKKKSLILVDRMFPQTEEDQMVYWYSLNCYPADEIDFSKLYSFDETVKNTKKER